MNDYKYGDVVEYIGQDERLIYVSQADPTERAGARGKVAGALDIHRGWPVYFDMLDETVDIRDADLKPITLYGFEEDPPVRFTGNLTCDRCYRNFTDHRQSDSMCPRMKGNPADLKAEARFWFIMRYGEKPEKYDDQQWVDHQMEAYAAGAARQGRTS